MQSYETTASYCCKLGLQIAHFESEEVVQDWADALNGDFVKF
jgi:hypothetical protein